MTITRNRIYTFTVAGSGIFPIDMLRYDSCYPVDTESANAINDSIDQETRFKGTRSFRLRGELPFGPTIGRWNSFGFNVSDVEENRP